LGVHTDSESGHVDPDARWPERIHFGRKGLTFPAKVGVKRKKRKIPLDEGESTLVKSGDGMFCARKLLCAETVPFFEENV
jgi:hypothetical protein